MKSKMLCLLAMTVVSGCGVSQQDYDTLQNTCDSLRQVTQSQQTEIEDLKYGAERLVNLAKNCIADGKYIQAQTHIAELKHRHPEAKEIAYFNDLADEIARNADKERAAIEKHRRDSIKLANINNLGIWDVGYYVDSFGEPTEEAFVATNVSGTFSNSATTNSPLTVRFLIDEDSIRIQLYEYAGNHPIKGEGYLTMQIKDADGKAHTIETYNNDYGDNTVLPKHDATLRKVLENGGTIKFVAVANRFGVPSEYKFAINNADFLENALIKAGLKQL